MINFFIKRIGSGIAVLIAVIILISSIIYLAPVDPERLTFGQRSDLGTVEAKKKSLGLDQPLYKQLLYYFRDLSPVNLSSNEVLQTTPYNFLSIWAGKDKTLVLKAPYLRESYQTGRKVSSILAEAIPKTALLAFSAILFACIIGLILGIVAAQHKNSWIDTTLITVSTLGYSLPSYVSAIVLAVVFGFLLQAYTGLQIQGSLIELNEIGDEVVVWKNLILPSIALGIRPLSIIMQLTRSAMLDVMKMNYITTAKAKGLSNRVVLLKHAFRNALNPFTTAISGWFAALLAGAFFVESVFNFRGLGDVTITALINYDIPVILGAVIFTCIVFVVINIFVDIIYVMLDPKMSLK